MRKKNYDCLLRTEKKWRSVTSVFFVIFYVLAAPKLKIENQFGFRLTAGLGNCLVSGSSLDFSTKATK